MEPPEQATKARTPAGGETRPKGPAQSNSRLLPARRLPGRLRTFARGGGWCPRAGADQYRGGETYRLGHRTPCGARALPKPQLKEPLSGRTEAEQRLRLSQQKGPNMPGAVLGQPPARGTLGFVVYARDGVFAHFVSQPFNVAFILPLWSQHSDFLVAARPHVLQYPEVSSSRPSARLFWTTVPRSTLKCFPLSLPGPQFPETSVSPRFSSLLLSWLGFGRPGGAPRRRDPS